MLGPLDTGLRGMQAGFDRLDRAAARVANDGAAGDLAGNLVEVVQAQVQVRVNAAVVRAAEDTIGTLLDVLA